MVVMPGRGLLLKKHWGLRWQSRRRQDAVGDDAGTVVEVDVGGNLRRLREERDLTIRALADKSGLAVNTLSLIENAKTSPSVSTLQQLAAALQVPVAAFFEVEAPEDNIAYIKAGNRPQAAFVQGTLADLGAGTSIRAVEPFIVTLEPQASSGYEDIVHTGFEFVYCLEGQIGYTIRGRTYLLEPGDSLLFEAHLPHRWQNLGPGVSRSILVLYPTDERDYPTERHFMGASS
jgi:transcriptional regulator with XRE-family HTH domain